MRTLKLSFLNLNDLAVISKKRNMKSFEIGCVHQILDQEDVAFELLSWESVSLFDGNDGDGTGDPPTGCLNCSVQFRPPDDKHVLKWDQKRPQERKVKNVSIMTEAIAKMVKTAKTTIQTKFALIPTALKKTARLDILTLANLEEDASLIRKISVVSLMLLLSVMTDLRTWKNE